jgi:hypothetical protein
LYFNNSIFLDYCNIALYSENKRYVLKKKKLEHFSALLPGTQKNYRRCRQQGGTLFCVVGNNEEKYSRCRQQRR